MKRRETNRFSCLTCAAAVNCLLRQTAFTTSSTAGQMKARVTDEQYSRSQQYVTAFISKEKDTQQMREVMTNDSRSGGHFDTVKSCGWRRILWNGGTSLFMVVLNGCLCRRLIDSREVYVYSTDRGVFLARRTSQTQCQFLSCATYWNNVLLLYRC